MALREIRRRGEHRVATLLTTVTEAHDRVSMHGVRRSLLRRQADALGAPLTEVVLPPTSSMAGYERAMSDAFARLKADGIGRVGFGDIFLRDLRDYRERQLAACGLEGLFPLWGRSTATLASSFIQEGFRAIVVCVNKRSLDASFAGRPFDDAFLADLPAEADPCGENGEFHTFVVDGPIFGHRIAVSCGITVERDGFAFRDLIERRAAAPRTDGSRAATHGGERQ